MLIGSVSNAVMLKVYGTGYRTYLVPNQSVAELEP
jgi:hypothetical protein